MMINLRAFRMKQNILWLFLSLLILTACDDRVSQVKLVDRTVLTMEVGSSETANHLIYAGKLRAKQRAALSFEIPGTVTRLNAELGDIVERSFVLGRLDNELYALDLAAKEAELTATQSKHDDAKLEFDRISTLSNKGVVSKSSLDKSKANLDIVSAQLLALKAGVDNAKKRLQYTVLTSPYRGEIVSRGAEQSQIVGAGQTVFEIVGLDAGLEAVFFVSSSIRQYLKNSTVADLRLLPGKQTLDAKVSEIGGRANSAGLFPVVVDLLGEVSNAKAGQSVEVNLHISKLENSHPIIPLTSYTMKPDGQVYVFVVNDQKVYEQNVQLGEISDLGVEIKSGLSDGEIIAVKGVDLLHHQQSIIPVDIDNNHYGL